MNLIIEYSDPDDLLDQIAIFMERAAKAERAFGEKMNRKFEKERSEYTAISIENLASSIRNMRAKRVRQNQT